MESARLGLCHNCLHAKRVETPRSVFTLCLRSRDDARFPRYPRLPVLQCPGHEPAPPGAAGEANAPLA